MKHSSWFFLQNHGVFLIKFATQFWK